MIIIIIPALAFIFSYVAASAMRCALNTGAIGPDNAHNMAGITAGAIIGTANDMQNGVTTEQNTATAVTINGADTIVTICTSETRTTSEAQIVAAAIGQQQKPCDRIATDRPLRCAIPATAQPGPIHALQ